MLNFTNILDIYENIKGNLDKKFDEIKIDKNSYFLSTHKILLSYITYYIIHIPFFSTKTILIYVLLLFYHFVEFF